MKLSGVIAFLFCWSVLHTQIDTSLVLDEISIRASMLRQSETGAVIIDRSDSSILARIPMSVSEWINSEQIGYIKSYGFGGLSTLSVRGLSAGHSLVVWNGLPVESPMLGQLDLSLLPLDLIESVDMTYGGQSGQWGSGAIGGVLNLENNTTFDDGFRARLTASAGQFDRYRQSGQISWSGQKFYTNTRIYNHASVNDYPFKIDDQISGVQSHAKVRMHGLLQSAGFRPSERDQIDIHYWYQKSNRQIPPTLRQTSSEASQDDETNRLALNYRHLRDRLIITGTFGYFNESLRYTDPVSRIDSKSRFHSYLTDVGLQYGIVPDLTLTVATTLNYVSARIQNYNGWRDQMRWSGFLGFKVVKDILVLDLNIRQEVIDGQRQPLMPNLGIDIYCSPDLVLKGKISRNFRYPTLNDLYWIPGGNEELQPETGWSEEATVIYDFSKGTLASNSRLSVFHKTVDNWIYWAPVDGMPIWSANNLGRVRSWGIEFRQGTSINYGEWKPGLDLGLNYNRSRNLESLVTPRIEEGQRLFYVPDHQVSLGLKSTWRTWEIKYEHRWIDEVLGINRDIAGYDIGDLKIGWKDEVGTVTLGVYLSVENIWDANYQVIEDRPMPGRYFETGVQLSFE